MDTLDDMQTLFAGIDLGEVSRVDDDQRPRGDHARLLRRRGRAGRRRRGWRGARGAAVGHDPGGHPQGVHRPEGVVLSDRPRDAPVRGHDRVVHPPDAALAPDLDLRLPHPRGRLDGPAGARVHAQGRPHLRRAGGRARAGRRRVRTAAVVLLQRPDRLLRGDRQVPRRPPHLGARAARDLRRQATRARGRCAFTPRRRASH